MTSTSSPSRPGGSGGGPATPSPARGAGAARGALAVVFWLAVWQLGSMAVGQELLLVSPVDVVVTLAGQVRTAEFWSSVVFSLVRIVSGFLLALLAGTLLAALGGANAGVRTLVAPLVLTVRSVPVVSFILLVLIWADSASLSVVISFLIALPVVYTNVLEGIDQRDRGLLEMAHVFRIPRGRRLRAVDLPAVMPYLLSASRSAIGLSWKSGIAAEVIGLPQGSIGEQLYQAKILLLTAEVFSWTVVIVLLSFLCERLFLAGLRHAADRAGSWGE